MSEAAKFATFLYAYSVKMGVCVPSGCTVEDLDQVAKMLGDYLMLEIKTSRCEVKEEIHFSDTNICVMYSFGEEGVSLGRPNRISHGNRSVRPKNISAGVHLVASWSLAPIGQEKEW
ncbi:hypothetical protein AVEN_90733-1 [Araneus ventricosus]|uniref:Nose resistant-to-fluoxetine protein N-terminal domain-containing protein n=1 Tax=Araneus ventricosus TaxID=182803 RepID=A0A4Y2W9W7_ARAVE|nr:hypothetical protein AVEN_90733-1 [Araneus ventricosus]